MIYLSGAFVLHLCCSLFGNEWQSGASGILDFPERSRKNVFFSSDYFPKKKRKKRKSSGKQRFQMESSFFEKILPNCCNGEESSLYSQKRIVKGEGGDFFKNPQGLNFTF
jgi:hypothetical protein